MELFTMEAVMVHLTPEFSHCNRRLSGELLLVAYSRLWETGNGLETSQARKANVYLPF